MSNVTTGKTPYTKPLTVDELLAMPDEDIIADDVPYNPNDAEAVAAYWQGAVIKKGDVVIGHTPRRGKQVLPTKVATTVRLSPEVIAYFKAGGKGWQTRLDAVLREYVATH